MHNGSVWLAAAFAGPIGADDGGGDATGWVRLSVDSPSVLEGGAAAWTVTATADRRDLAESGQILEVRVVSADDWAEASSDYRPIDQRVSLQRSDFARDRAPAKRRGVFAGRHRPVGVTLRRRWIARKSGTVTILDDVMVEETETFVLAPSITGGVGWAFDTEVPVEVAIDDTDTWDLELVASPKEIAEGTASEVVLTARILQGDGNAPGPRTCVVPFPVRVRLATSGSASRGADYTLTGLPDDWRIVACDPEVSWTVRQSVHGGDEDDADETVIVTPLVERHMEYDRTVPAFVTPALVTIRERR